MKSQIGTLLTATFMKSLMGRTIAILVSGKKTNVAAQECRFVWQAFLGLCRHRLPLEIATADKQKSDLLPCGHLAYEPVSQSDILYKRLETKLNNNLTNYNQTLRQSQRL